MVVPCARFATLVIVVFLVIGCAPEASVQTTPTPLPPTQSLPTLLPPTEPPAASTAPSATTPTNELLRLATSLKPAIAEQVKLDDIQMYYAVYGEGKPLILLHGGMGSGLVFSNQVPLFAQHYRVIVPDNRGQGRTTDSEVPVSYHLMATDTLRLMDYLKIDSAYILGESDGAIIGLDMAIHHPERVEALVAYGANTTPDGFKPDLLAYLRDTPSAVLQKDLSYDYLMLSPTPEHLPVITEKIRTMWLTQPNFTTAELASIKAPTLVLDGEAEEYIRPEHTKSIAASIPHAELVLMPGVGHYAQQQKPVQFNKIVLDFLVDK